MVVISNWSHCYFFHEHHSSVAQLVEQAAVNRLVGGSSPSRGARNIKGLDVFRLTLFYLSELLSELFDQGFHLGVSASPHQKDTSGHLYKPKGISPTIASLDL